ncbi:putative alpha-L-fucosidase [Medicago truncatula]|uniref:alpha-L-fucosidase n=2 Tax=Medicago truncatula TaxID=3880 RepID=A0A396JI19_MEDTR|nr:alpha-L-fucosidase 1 [Medicago truncatula]RHN76005.1 putative alpha-L-fucosidase [Medicago truncatula]
MKKNMKTRLSFSTKIHNPNHKIQTSTLLIFPIQTFLIQLLCSSLTPVSSNQTPPPLPILPLPTAFQLQWQNSNMALFFHFGTNTFTDSEWGTGQAHPTIFNPTKLNASQWIHVAKDTGFSRVLLTAKHHDGFCLWPSEYTDYSVRSSGWRNGNGDVVADVAAAAGEAGVGFGIYLSPWDRHELCYGDTLRYNQHYLAQMTELLTRYGEIKDVFLDGAKGEGEKNMKYFFESWFSLIHQLQPGAAIFSDSGPDTRWVGNEQGVAGSTCWSLFNQSVIEIGGVDNDPQYQKQGDPFGLDWVPALCDVSIRPGWFWHASEHPKSARKLLEIYYKSVGRNCKLLLNVPPNSSGLISAEDIQVLREFSELRHSIFSHNFAASASLNASSTRGGIQDTRFSPNKVLEEGIHTYWAPEENQSKWILYINLKKLVSFNVLQVQEPIHMGQRVIKFHLEALNRDGLWKSVVNGTTIGYQRLLLFPKLKSQYLKLVVDKSRAEPLISYLGIYLDPVTVLSEDMPDKKSGTYFNGTQVLRSAMKNDSQSATM